MVATSNRQASGEGMLDVFRAYGVDYVFSSPGSEWPALWDALARTEVEGVAPRYINARHEMVAIGVAMGYYRQARRLPVVLLHTGVGTAHAAMELRAARTERIPMVVMAGEGNAFGESPGRDPGAQWYRYLADVGGPAELAGPFVKRAHTVGSEPVLLNMVADACRLSLTPPHGPVFLGVPMEWTLAPDATHVPAAVAPPPAPLQASPADLDRVAAMLAAAERPVILTETLGRDPADVPRLVALAEPLGVPVVEAYSPVYLNFPRQHPLHLGYQAKGIVDDADLILLLGCQAAWYPPSAKPPGAKLVAIHPDPAFELLPYWAMDVEVSLGGALGPALDGLLAAIKDRVRPGDPAVAERTAHWRAEHDRQRAAWAAAANGLASQSPIDPRFASQVLGEVLPVDAIVSEELTTERT